MQRIRKNGKYDEKQEYNENLIYLYFTMIVKLCSERNVLRDE